MCLMDGFAHRSASPKQSFDIAIGNPPRQQLLWSPDPDCLKGSSGHVPAPFIPREAADVGAEAELALNSCRFQALELPVPEFRQI